MRLNRWVRRYHERPYFLSQGILTIGLALSMYQFGDVYMHIQGKSVMVGARERKMSFKFHLAFVPATKTVSDSPTSWYTQTCVVPSYIIPGLVCVMAEVMMSRLRLGDQGLQLLEHVISSLNHSLCIWESKPLCPEQSYGEARNQGLLPIAMWVEHGSS